MAMYYVKAAGVDGLCMISLDDGQDIGIIFDDLGRAFRYAQHCARSRHLDYEVRTFKKDKLRAVVYRDGSFFKTPKYLKLLQGE